MRTEGRTDITKMTVDFRNFANALQNDFLPLGLNRVIELMKKIRLIIVFFCECMLPVVGVHCGYSARESENLATLFLLRGLSLIIKYCKPSHCSLLM